MLLAALRPRLGALLHSSAARTFAGKQQSSSSQQLGSKVIGSTQLSTAAAAAELPAAPETYTKAASWLHWAFAAGFLTCIATVQASMNSKDNAFKGQMMTIHKTTGLLLAGLALPRIIVRLTSRLPVHLPGPAWEQLGANLSHVALYAVLIIMPGTGIAMGYFGGKGLPFFGWHIPGAEKPNGALAKQAFGIHKQAGQVVEYGLLPLHVAGAGLHVMRGHQIFKRVNPFA